MAHTKSGGSTRLGRDSVSKRLGVKVNDQEQVRAGEIIIRQRGTHYRPGENVRRGGDDTLYAARGGVVRFSSKRRVRFDGSTGTAKVVSVIPAAPVKR